MLRLWPAMDLVPVQDPYFPHRAISIFARRSTNPCVALTPSLTQTGTYKESYSYFILTFFFKSTYVDTFS